MYKFVIGVLCGVLALAGCGQEPTGQAYNVTMSKGFTPTTYECGEGYNPVVIRLGAFAQSGGSPYALTQGLDDNGNQISITLEWTLGEGMEVPVFIIDNADHEMHWAKNQQTIYRPALLEDMPTPKVTLMREDFGGDSGAAITSATACERRTPSG